MRCAATETLGSFRTFATVPINDRRLGQEHFLKPITPTAAFVRFPDHGYPLIERLCRVLLPRKQAPPISVEPETTRGPVQSKVRKAIDRIGCRLT